MSHVDIGSNQLYYETAGSGEPVVLMHGLGADSRVWDPKFEALANSHRVIRYDLRGYGRGRDLDGVLFERYLCTVKYQDIYLKDNASVPHLLTGRTSHVTICKDERQYQRFGRRTPAEVHFTWKHLV